MKNLQISTRLTIAFAVVLLVSLVIAALGIWRMHAISDAKDKMAAAAHTDDLAGEWLRGIATNSVRTFAFVKLSDEADRNLLQTQMKVTSDRVNVVQKELESLITTDKGKALLDAVAAKRSAYTTERNAVFELREAGSLEAVSRQTSATMLPAMEAYIASVQALVDYQKTVFNAANRDIDNLYRSSRTLLSLCALFALLAGAGFAWRLTVGITRPLNAAVEVARTVAKGDLTSHIAVASKDETGQLMLALKEMNQNLVAIVTQVRTGTETIAIASSQISAGNQDLSSRTEQQASSLGETAASMEELTSTVKQNAENAYQANQLSSAASDVAARGGEAVVKVIDTMNDINESSGRIADIISVMDSIAFQTNILALNAAVEAARAGEQGRGFAVVASEVRSLAQRSAAAAKEIEALINDSVQKVSVGTTLVRQAGATMNEVVGSVRRVTDVMAEIQAASQEQSTSIEQVNRAIGQMDQVTQQNAALVEEAAAAAQSLQAQAAKLSQTVTVFSVR